MTRPEWLEFAILRGMTRATAWRMWQQFGAELELLAPEEIDAAFLEAVAAVRIAKALES